MRSEGSGDGVGLPEIHLVAAGTELTSTSVGVRGGWGPADSVGLCTKFQ
jgi:hypothetical protein